MKTQLHRFILPSRREVFYFTFFAVLMVAIMPMHVAQADYQSTTWLGQGIQWIGEKTIGAAGFVASAILDPVLYAILQLLAWLANLSAIVFTFTLNPEAFSEIMNNDAVYAIWKITRDFLNMFFIAILLFSAFATIFQISSYNYKRVLLNLIIMALLVNFSWPISRAIIDFFNIMMYYFVDLMGYSRDEVSSHILAIMSLESFMVATNAGTFKLLLAIIVMGLFAWIQIRIALVLLIRLVALPILVMLSPIGFVGMIAPFLHSYAKKWWGYLLQYAIAGPLIVFMVLASLKVLEVAHQPLTRVINVDAPQFTSGNK